MSGNSEVLTLKEDDVTKMLAAGTHLGTTNVDFQMERYIYKRRQDGVRIINLRHTWEKLLLAARAVVAIEHPSEVFVISSRMFGQRAVLKFAAHTGATPITGRFTPGKNYQHVIIALHVLYYLKKSCGTITIFKHT